MSWRIHWLGMGSTGFIKTGSQSSQEYKDHGVIGAAENRRIVQWYRSFHL